MIKNNGWNKIRSGSMCKSLFLLLISISLIFGGIVIHREPWKEEDKPFRYGTLIFIFGDGFDSVFKADVNVWFNDLGKVDLSFELSGEEDEPQNAWVVICNPFDPYTWAIEGSIENRKLDRSEEFDVGEMLKRDWTTAKSEQTSGRSDSVTCFHVAVDDDMVQERIEIQLDEQYITRSYGEIVALELPVVSTVFLSNYDAYSMDVIVNNIMEAAEENEMDDADSDRVVRHIFSSGSIDGSELSMAMSKITGCYQSEKYYKDSKYRLRTKEPLNGEENMEYIIWKNNYINFIPTIEYVENRGWISRLVEFFLLSLGGFLLPISFEEIYSNIFDEKFSVNELKSSLRRIF